MSITAGTNSERVRAVIVDDTADLRQLLRLALVRGGLDVVGDAGDGRAAIDVVGATHPDLVLLDLSMPVMDGLEALPHLRALVPRAKIIVLSGFGALQMAERALAAGADGYLQKGMSPRRILDKVLGILATTETSTEPAPEPTLRMVPPITTPETTREPGSESDPAVATLALALAMAPYGVLKIEPQDPFAILYANPAAGQVLGKDIDQGLSLMESAPELATHLGAAGAEGDRRLQVQLPDRTIAVTVRQAGESLLIYLVADPE